MKIYFSLFLLPLLILACTTSPTGRNQLLLMGNRQMSDMGDQSFEQMQKEVPISRNSKDNRYVRCITDRLLSAIGENPRSWKVRIFQDKSLNAFALPGKNIGVHTGMLNFAQSQHQLAAVIGHEIGHVLANHGNERVSQALVTQLGLQATEVALGSERSEKNNLILAGLGLGAQFGVLLPFSRKHESEADLLGLEYMSKAGFNPRGAVELWQNMASNSKGSPPEILSTHPANSTRIRNLSRHLSKYTPIYQATPNKPQCLR
ncbi:MAG: peptidase [Bdellovibrionaceae bacterium]|nr:peptidase [Pseudobdellovibrionaceae bacterium]|tara:strand:- start:147699 stop:148481 length:783 start_codon:yes stop_codon:yes gene_type:complete